MKGDERKPDQTLTLLIEIIFSIEIHEVKIVVVPISCNEKLGLEDVVHFINQIYFTVKNWLLMKKLKIYFPDRNVCRNLNLAF